MAQIAKPPIPYKIYRHFAVITLVLTALIAFFADGESRDAVADHLEEQQRTAELQRVSAKRTRQPELQMRNNVAPTSFDPGTSDNFGRPTLDTRQGNTTIAPTTDRPQRPEARSLPGHSTSYLNSLSEEEYQALVESLRKAGMLSGQQREQNIAAFERMSRQRSGEATRSQDIAP